VPLADDANVGFCTSAAGLLRSRPLRRLDQSLQPVHVERSFHPACNIHPIPPACTSRRGSAAPRRFEALLRRVWAVENLQTVNTQKNLEKNFKSNPHRMIRPNFGHKTEWAL
jgi:hypothetical protein